ncbi:MAG: 50S ribosomal protein L19 [Bacteroidales bacterium]|nr:50S ribosomal protein L19 [Bacteroidales bacterium]MBP5782631.1 50S ribosomal protein L19 [Bacteroidales bacterium]
MKQELLQYVDGLTEVKQYPDFKAGDTITVTYRIVEGNKERTQKFQGIVIQRRGGSNPTATFTVRKISNNIGVERIFPVASPFIESIDVNKHGKVRRARIYYLRNLKGKKAKIKERKMVSNNQK